MPNRTLHFFRKDLVDSNSKDKDWNQTQKREDVHWTTGGFANEILLIPLKPTLKW